MKWIDLLNKFTPTANKIKADAPAVDPLPTTDGDYQESNRRLFRDRWDKAKKAALLKQEQDRLAEENANAWRNAPVAVPVPKPIDNTGHDMRNEATPTIINNAGEIAGDSSSSDATVKRKSTQVSRILGLNV